MWENDVTNTSHQTFEQMFTMIFTCSKENWNCIKITREKKAKRKWKFKARCLPMIVFLFVQQLTPHAKTKRIIATFTRINNFPMQIPVDSLAAFVHVTNFKDALFYMFVLFLIDTDNDLQPPSQRKVVKRILFSLVRFSSFSIVCNLIRIFSIPKESKCVFFSSFAIVHQPLRLSFSLHSLFLHFCFRYRLFVWTLKNGFKDSLAVLFYQYFFFSLIFSLNTCCTFHRTVNMM